MILGRLSHETPTGSLLPYANHGAGIYTCARAKSPSHVGNYTMDGASGIANLMPQCCYHAHVLREAENVDRCAS